MRELRNLIEQAFITSFKDTLRIQVPRETGSAPSGTLTADEMERRHIMKVLEMTKGRIKGSHRYTPRLRRSLKRSAPPSPLEGEG